MVFTAVGSGLFLYSPFAHIFQKFVLKESIYFTCSSNYSLLHMLLTIRTTVLFARNTHFLDLHSFVPVKMTHQLKTDILFRCQHWDSIRASFYMLQSVATCPPGCRFPWSNRQVLRSLCGDHSLSTITFTFILVRLFFSRRQTHKYYWLPITEQTCQ